MKRTTVMLPSRLRARAERRARRLGVSLAELIRNSLERQLRDDKPQRRDPVFADHFVFNDNGPPDVSANVDKYLGEIADEEYRREQRR